MYEDEESIFRDSEKPGKNKESEVLDGICSLVMLIGVAGFVIVPTLFCIYLIFFVGASCVESLFNCLCN